jgi:DNA-binding response OmpR family regulator
MLQNGTPVPTSATELNLLRYLLFRRGEIVSRDEIFRDVWGYDQAPTSRSVDNYILSLRKKIEQDPARPQHLVTLRGAGYRLVLPSK